MLLPIVNNDTIFKDENWIVSSVGKNGIDSIDMTVRNSMVSKYKFTMDYPMELFNDLHLRVDNLPLLNLQLLKYNEGNFFARHKDRKYSEKHKYTILILPPMSVGNIFTGGEICINGQEIIQDINKYKIIIFSLDLIHNINPVLSGIRYVFKGVLYSDYNVENYLTTSLIDTIPNLNFNESLINPNLLEPYTPPIIYSRQRIVNDDPEPLDDGSFMFHTVGGGDY
jgi:hypothetical protein